MTLEELKQKYPYYQKVPDQQLADTLYNKYYAGKIPRDQFDVKVGLTPQTGVGETLLHHAATGLAPGAGFLASAGAVEATPLAHFAPPYSEIIAPLLAGLAGSGAVGYLQDKLLTNLAPAFSRKLGVEQQQHPIASTTGNVLGSLPLFGAGGIPTATKAATSVIGRVGGQAIDEAGAQAIKEVIAKAALGGGVTTGQELAFDPKHQVNPLHVIQAMLEQQIYGKPTELGSKIEGTFRRDTVEPENRQTQPETGSKPIVEGAVSQTRTPPTGTPTHVSPASSTISPGDEVSMAGIPGFHVLDASDPALVTVQGPTDQKPRKVGRDNITLTEKEKFLKETTPLAPSGEVAPGDAVIPKTEPAPNVLGAPALTAEPQQNQPGTAPTSTIEAGKAAPPPQQTPQPTAGAAPAATAVNRPSFTKLVHESSEKGLKEISSSKGQQVGRTPEQATYFKKVYGGIPGYFSINEPWFGEAENIYQAMQDKVDTTKLVADLPALDIHLDFDYINGIAKPKPDAGPEVKELVPKSGIPISELAKRWDISAKLTRSVGYIGDLSVEPYSNTPDKPTKIMAAVKTNTGYATGANHPEVLAKLGEEIPPAGKRNTPRFGYAVTLPDGTEKFVNRAQMGRLAKKYPDLQLEQFRWPDAPHSNEIKDPATQVAVSEQGKVIGDLPKDIKEKLISATTGTSDFEDTPKIPVIPKWHSVLPEPPETGLEKPTVIGKQKTEFFLSREPDPGRFGWDRPYLSTIKGTSQEGAYNDAIDLFKNLKKLGAKGISISSSSPDEIALVNKLTQEGFITPVSHEVYDFSKKLLDKQPPPLEMDRPATPPVLDNPEVPNRVMGGPETTSQGGEATKLIGENIPEEEQKASEGIHASGVVDKLPEATRLAGGKGFLRRAFANYLRDMQLEDLTPEKRGGVFADFVNDVVEGDPDALGYIQKFRAKEVASPTTGATSTPAPVVEGGKSSPESTPDALPPAAVAGDKGEPYPEDTRRIRVKFDETYPGLAGKTTAKLSEIMGESFDASQGSLPTNLTALFRDFTKVFGDEDVNLMSFIGFQDKKLGGIYDPGSRQVFASKDVDNPEDLAIYSMHEVIHKRSYNFLMSKDPRATTLRRRLEVMQKVAREQASDFGLPEDHPAWRDTSNPTEIISYLTDPEVFNYISHLEVPKDKSLGLTPTTFLDNIKEVMYRALRFAKVPIKRAMLNELLDIIGEAMGAEQPDVKTVEGQDIVMVQGEKPEEKEQESQFGAMSSKVINTIRSVTGYNQKLLSAYRDGIDQQSRRFGDIYKRRVERYDPEDNHAMTWLAAYDGKTEDLIKAKETLTEDSPFQKELDQAIELSKNPEQTARALAARSEFVKMRGEESARGIKVGERAMYVPKRVQQWLVDPAEPFGGRVPRVGGRAGHLKPSTTESFADYVAAIEKMGGKPETSLARLAELRGRDGVYQVAKREMVQASMKMKDPVTGAKLVVGLKEGGKNRRNYDLVGEFDSRHMVHRSVSGLFSDLFGSPSDNTLTQVLAKGSQIQKRIGVFYDVFHLNLTELRGLSTMYGKEGYEGGVRRLGKALVQGEPEDWARAVANKEITPDMQKELMRVKPTFDRYTKLGLAVGKHSEQVEGDIIDNIPIFGPSMKSVSKYTFNEVTSSAVAEAALKFGEINKKLHPDWSQEKVDLKTVEEANQYFYQIGRSGVLKSAKGKQFAQIILFAHSFFESQVRTEIEGLSQAVKAPMDLATKGKIGNIIKAQLAAMATIFVVNQAINLKTRGHFTWDNPEDDKKFSAYIPPMFGKTPHFIDPWYISFPVTATIAWGLRERKTPIEAIRDLLYNRLSVWGQMARQVATERTPEGKPTRGMSTAQQAETLAETAAPVPFGVKEFVNKGDVDRQILTSFGLKPTPVYGPSGEEMAISRDKIGNDEQANYIANKAINPTFDKEGKVTGYEVDSDSIDKALKDMDPKQRDQVERLVYRMVRGKIRSKYKIKGQAESEVLVGEPKD